MNGMQGPGGCQGPEECMKYCSDPAHQAECGIFGGPEGMTGGPGGQNMGAPGFGGPIGGMMETAGPGGCKGPEECVKYCSDPAHREECAKFNPSQGAMPPGEMFRQILPGTEASIREKMESMAQCGPRPGIPTPMGCTGPVCKEGHWGFDCPQGERVAPPTPGMMLPMGTQQPTTPTMMQIREGAACTQEWRPVCGTNQRTYPNACFAKADNVVVAKEGACEGQAGSQTNTEGFRPPEGIINIPPQPYPGYYPPPAGSTQYQQFTPPPAEIAPPQTRRSPSDIFFATILQAFRNLLPH